MPPYLTPQFPSGDFMITDQNGDQGGPFNGKDFEQLADNVWAAQLDGGHPFYLRVINQTGLTITSVDGGGQTWVYTMQPAVITK